MAVALPAWADAALDAAPIGVPCAVEDVGDRGHEQGSAGGRDAPAALVHHTGEEGGVVRHASLTRMIPAAVVAPADGAGRERGGLVVLAVVVDVYVPTRRAV